MTIFETKRIEFRHLVPNDFDNLYRMYSDGEMRRYFPDGVRSKAETREELEWFLNGHPTHPKLGLWATVEKSTGSFIGRSGLLPWVIDGVLEVEIAYMVVKERWGDGFGSEIAKGLVSYAFDTLGLDSVIALIDRDHSASIRTAESAGLTFEKEIFFDGVTSAVYSIFKDPMVNQKGLPSHGTEA